MGKAIRQLLTILVALGIFWLLWIFAQGNPEPLQLKFHSWRTLEIQTGILILGVFALGVLVSAFFLFSILVMSMVDKRRLRRENESIQRLLDQHYSSSSKTNTPPA